MTSEGDGEITLCICTFNRCGFLKMCMEALQPQLLLFPKVRLLVIDNGSSDDTKAMLVSNAERWRFDYFFEPAVGLSHARNRAIQECRSKYLVFIDDDGYPTARWLAAVVDAANCDPDVFGGPFQPFYLEKKPSWFQDRYASAHCEDEPGWKPFGYAFSGGNMGWSLSYLRSRGGFDPHLGMTGGRLRLGEETSLQVCPEARPLRRLLVKDMLLMHYAAPSKMSIAYMLRRSFIYGASLHLIDSNSKLLGKTVIRFLMDTRFFFPLIIRLDFPLNQKSKRYLADFVSLHGMSAGVIWSRIARRFKSLWSGG